MTRKISFIFSITGLIVMLAAVGYWMLFSNFATYDDEGYILISARQYFLHGGLYEAVYSQYGPAFYGLMDLLQRTFGLVDHTFARILTLGFWLGSAICCGGMVWRQTASRSLSLFTLAAVFLYLYFITDEPFHPGSLIFFILAASLWVATGLIEKSKWSRVAIVTGASGAILLLTKINVGAFYVIAVGTWATAHAASDRIRRLSRPCLALMLCAFAVVLMHTLIREPWVQSYLILFGCGTIGLLAAIPDQSLISRKFTGWFIATGFAMGIIVLLSIWLRGTSLTGIIEGVLLGPLRHPGNYSYPVDWRPGTLLVAGISLAMACVIPWLEKSHSHKLTEHMIVALRCLVFLGLLVGVSVLINMRAVGAIFSFVAPLIWVSITPVLRTGASPRQQAARTLVAMVLLLQFLHAYPVGGAQESWGTFLFIPLVAMGIGDVRTWLTAYPRSVMLQRFGWKIMGSVLLTVVTMKTGWAAWRAHGEYHARTELNLPGAERLRLPPTHAAAYRILTLNAVVHTDILFSLPGMFSFNLWTGLPSPTDKNTTLWFSLLNESEQAEIIRQLETHPRAGIIVQNSLVDLMRTNQIPMKGILWDYIHQHFRAAFKSDGFAFWIKNDRILTPLNIATSNVPIKWNSKGTKYDTQLDFSILSQGGPIAWIEVAAEAKQATTIPRLDGKNAQVSIAHVTSDGRWAAPPLEVSWPVEAQGLVHFTVRFERKDQQLLTPDTLLILRGSQGENLGEIRLAE